MLQCLKQSVSRAQSSLIPQKSSPWIVQRWSVPFVPPQDTPPSMQSTHQNPSNKSHLHYSKDVPTASCTAKHFWVKGISFASSPCERCRKHTFIAVIGLILKPNPLLTTCVLQKLRDFQEPPREPFIQLSNCSFLPQGASSWKISNSSPSQNSAGIPTCQAGTAGKVFHYPIKLLLYPCPLWRLPEITATPVRLMLCLCLSSFIF